ncbi:MAG: hypothetical protein K2Y26_14295 [Gemmatimonadaceae bacterium]|nr:hypothetical protein [Gemmatimonadaceae bacterium]
MALEVDPRGNQFRGVVMSLPVQGKSSVTFELTGEATGQVIPQVAALLRVAEPEGRRSDLMGLLSLKHRWHVTDAYLNPALEAELIEMTIPDKPTSRLQRYRLTAKGAATLAILSEDRTR